MSIFQPVSFAARRAFWPLLPIASESWLSGTVTLQVCEPSAAGSTERTVAGASAEAMNYSGSSL